MQEIYKIKFIKEKRNATNTKKKYIQLKVFGNELDIVGTIFDHTKKGYTIKANRIQAILVFLLNNPDKFFKLREIQNRVISERRDLFYTNSLNTSSDDAEIFYKPFDECLNILKIFYLVEVIEVPSEKKESSMVEAYRLSKFGKTIALIAKAHSNNFDPLLYDKIYEYWKAHFYDQTFSLDLFCNQYFQSCKESNLFDSFIKIFIDYFFDRHDIFSYTELFTQMIFFRFENDNLKNEKLWKLWKESMLSLNKRNGELYFNHVKIHIYRVIEKKAHDFAKFEVARFENRAAFNMVIIEATCKNCYNEYIYFPVPIIIYLPYLFYDKTNAQIYEYSRNNARCQKCNNSDFSFIII